MSDGYEPIRSYQRIFRPERRIYSIEGRPLPVPGGVPLRWLAYAVAALLGVAGDRLGLGGGGAALAGDRRGLPALAPGAGSAARSPRSAALAATWIGGLAIGLLDWPLRLVVIPAAVATLATQATPDGRRADRFALSWLAVHLAPLRRSLGRPLPATGSSASARRRALGRARRALAPPSPRPGPRPGHRLLLRGRSPCAARGRRRRQVARPPGRRARAGTGASRRLALGEREVLEVRP